MKNIGLLVLTMLVLITACEKKLTKKHNKYDEEYFNKIDSQWEVYVNKCFDECMSAHPDGSFVKNNKKYKCNKETINEFGLGGMGLELTPQDVCPKTEDWWLKKSKK